MFNLALRNTKPRYVLCAFGVYKTTLRGGLVNPLMLHFGYAK